MKDKTLEQLTDEEFEKKKENFISQEASGTDEIEVSTFFRLWDKIEKKRPPVRRTPGGTLPTIEVEGDIMEGRK